MRSRILIGLNVWMILQCYICASPDTSFDYFVFAQEWPVAVCTTGIEEHHSCDIPSHFNSWGIHGLCSTGRRPEELMPWRGVRRPSVNNSFVIATPPERPSKKDDKSFQNCDKSRPFDINKIKPLLPQLNESWPNLYNDTPHASFWEHEWNKHGTCALSIKETDSEFNYFSTTLNLNEKYNALNLLERSGIIPSQTAKWMYSDIIQKLTDVLTAEPMVSCTKNHKTGHFMLFQVEICLTKRFVPMQCYHYPKSDCPTNDLLEYPIIHPSRKTVGNVDTLRYLHQP